MAQISISASHIEERYNKYNKRKYLFISITIVALFLSILLALMIGSAEISFGDVLNSFLGKGDLTTDTIVFRIRLPRIFAAILVGCALGISGAVIQNILKNPLGSPFTLGISPAASFGAAFAVILLGAGSVHSASTDAVIVINPYLVSISAFFWCLAATAAILMGVKLKNAKPETIMLMGITIGSLFNAGTAALEYFAQDVQIASIIYWTFGNLSRGTWRDLGIILIVLIPAIIFFTINALKYNALDAGDDVAESLGINTSKLRTASMVIASLTVSMVVAFYGIIAFVGLIVPHIVRKALKSNENRFILISSGLFGGLFLLIADTFARIIVRPLILPVGVLTSFLGAPLFIYLLIKKDKI